MKGQKPRCREAAECSSFCDTAHKYPVGGCIYAIKQAGYRQENWTRSKNSHTLNQSID